MTHAVRRFDLRIIIFLRDLPLPSLWISRCLDSFDRVGGSDDEVKELAPCILLATASLESLSF